MKTEVLRLRTLLAQNHQLIVPVYQRHYEWETGKDKQIPRLWEDLHIQAIHNLEGRRRSPHFFGTIILSERERDSWESVGQYLIVDGQQRITSFQLTLCAIREVARSALDPSHGFQPKVDSFLLNEPPRNAKPLPQERYKLQPSQYDHQVFHDIVHSSHHELEAKYSDFFGSSGTSPDDPSWNLLHAYRDLKAEMETFLENPIDENEYHNSDILDALLDAVLDGFEIVMIRLNREDDDQEIFESLNGQGKPLSPFSLIRNDIFYRTRDTLEDGQAIYDNQWVEFDNPFWMSKTRQGRLNRTRSDLLIAYAVMAETGKDLSISNIVSEYRRYARKRGFDTVTGELDILLGHAKTYREMAEGNSPPSISRFAEFLDAWDMAVFHPFALAVAALDISDEQKTKLLRLAESYIVRRELCQLHRGNYNKWVASFVRAIRSGPESSALEILTNHIAKSNRPTSLMPNSTALEEALTHNPIYGDTKPISSPRLQYIFKQLEYAARSKEQEPTVLPHDKPLTIEHIMPRKWAEHWPIKKDTYASSELPDEAMVDGIRIDEEVEKLIHRRQRTINTLGNLTILTEPLNSSIGNAPWLDKRKAIAKSILAINQELVKSDDWCEKAIENRSLYLAKLAQKVWPGV